MRYHRSVIFLFLGLLGLLMVGGCATTDGENSGTGHGTSQRNMRSPKTG